MSVFIDLEDDSPNTPGIYTVKIKGSTGDRIVKATWTKRGFIPLEDNLIGEEYIYAWQNNSC